MADGDREMMDQARRQSQEFMLQARQQMQQQLEQQRYQIASTAGPAAAGLAGGGAPQAGTPSGRLMETITNLIQRGAGMAGGSAAGVAGAGMAQVGGMGSIFGQAMAAPIEMANRTGLDAGRSMTFWQSAATAMKIGFSAQRLDMTSAQAVSLASEEFGARARSGLFRGSMALLNLHSFGTAGYFSRALGLEAGAGGREALAAGLQQQLRYSTREELERAGLGGMAGPFSTGISRAGARELEARMYSATAAFQAETGLSGREMSVLRSQAAGTMGRRALIADMGVGGGGLDRNTRSVREIRQTLNMSEQESAEFFAMVGQMHGTADRIAGLARRAQGMGGRLGLNSREVMSSMLDFEKIGIQTGMGAGRARGIAEQYTQSLYENYTRGGISAQQLGMYGGKTPEEALRIQTQVRFQQNIGMWAGGQGLMGTGVLAGGNKWGAFMGGGMGFMGTMAAVGGEIARNPFAVLQGQYDPAQHQMMGANAERMAFNLTRSMAPMMLGDQGARQAQQIHMFSRMTGFKGLEATSRFEQFQAEFNTASKMMEGGSEKDARNLQSVYASIVGQGMGEAAIRATGKTGVWDAALTIYNTATAGGKTFDSSKDIVEMLAESQVGGVTKEEILRKIQYHPTLAYGPSLAYDTFGGGGFGEDIKFVNIRESFKKLGGYAESLKGSLGEIGVSSSALTEAVLGAGGIKALGGTISVSATGKIVFVDQSGAESEITPKQMDELNAGTRDSGGVKGFLGLTEKTGMRNVIEGALSKIPGRTLGETAAILQRGAGTSSLLDELSYQRVKNVAGEFGMSVRTAVSGDKFRAFASVIANADRAGNEQKMRDLGLGTAIPFSRLYRTTETGAFALEEGNREAQLEMIRGAFRGEKGSASLAGILGWKQEDVKTALGGGEGAAKLLERMGTKDVALGVLRSFTQNIETSKLVGRTGRNRQDALFTALVDSEGNDIVFDTKAGSKKKEAT